MGGGVWENDGHPEAGLEVVAILGLTRQGTAGCRAAGWFKRKAKSNQQT